MSDADFLYVFLGTPFFVTGYIFDILLCLLPRGRPCRQWTINKAVRVRTVRLLLLYWSLLRWKDRLPLKSGRERNRFDIIRPRSSKLYRGPLAESNISPEMLGVTWTPARPTPAVSTVVTLHFHGGGFVIGDGRDGDTGYLARTLIQQLGCTYVCTPQYRLSSYKGGQFPASLQDALTAYMHLIEELGIPPEQIILSGDSAGGNLVIGLLRYIQDYGQALGIVAPGAVMLFSPWVDVSAALLHDVKSSPNARSDYINTEFARWGASTISGSGAIDPASPYLSPLNHPFRLDFDIPVFINAGELEVLCDDIKAFSKVSTEFGWKIRLLISRGCSHDVLLLGTRMGFAREAEEAVRDARQFLSSQSALSLRQADSH